jgi:hypothetical protein
MKADDSNLLKTLKALLELHEQAGMDIRELQIVQLYNQTCLHLDAACYDLLHILLK